MTPFQTYRLYIALKTHFTRDDYDIVKSRGAITTKSKESFEKEKDFGQLYKISGKYGRKEIIDLLVANFATGDNSANIFGGEYEEIYQNYLTRRKRMLYNLNTDLDIILFEMEKDGIKSCLDPMDGHPLIFKLFKGRHIHIETVVIVEKLFPFVDNFIMDQFLDKDCLLIKKYKPFVRFDKDEVKQRFEGKISQCLNQ